MIPNLPHLPEVLRADVLTAKNFLDPACEAIANNEVTKEEGNVIYPAALSRYATALQRFCRLVLYGEVPSDLR
jgi:hypothetical protein